MVSNSSQLLILLESAMAVNKETHVNASVVMEIVTYEKLKAIAQKNKRSVSKQILFWVEEKLANENSA
jgi:hypothetical protein